METLLPLQDPTPSVPQTNPLVADEKKEKKCHGNRKLQRFKRKCRSRGMTEEQITELIQTRNTTQTNNLVVSTVLTSTTHTEKKNNNNKKKKKRQCNKRSRSDRKNEEQTNANTTTVRSMSQLSIDQPPRKKIKTNENKSYMAKIHQNLP